MAVVPAGITSVFPVEEDCAGAVVVALKINTHAIIGISLLVIMCSYFAAVPPSAALAAILIERHCSAMAITPIYVA
jgi:hypothetical protein